MTDLYTPETETEAEPSAPSRAGIARRVRAFQVRRRLGSSGLDLRNTWGVIVGAVLLPLGIAVILLGWNGAAHGRVDQQQLPYLISGGVLGLAIVIIGCFFYWSHWLYRLYDQADLHHHEMLREQREFMRTVAELMAGRAATSRPGPIDSEGHERVGVSANGTGSTTFVATPTGTNFHAPGCPMIAGRSADLRPVSAAEAEAMRPCRVCEPLAHSN